ncbi:MAG TPA: peptidyl-prolyl cis-trans isomerase [Solirubrobacteraceae bacterium]|nr:peptidyl-prolyl cis-trans isomerase [Solirubrobacteraceae bacterium]
MALGAFFVVVALTLTACGGSSLPGNAVVKIDDTTITKDQFNHWMTVAAKSQALQAGAKTTTTVVAPVSPDFAACIAQLRKTSKPAKGQPTPTTESLKAQCKTSYEGYRDQVLQLLISSDWYVGEAADQGVTVTKKALDAEFAKRKKQSFSTEKQYTDYLKTSGLTLEDLKLQVESELLVTKLREKITKSVPKTTDKAIHAYYVKNKSKYAQPERRDIRIVLTKTRAQAVAAKAALTAGQSWTTVAKKYSTDAATKNKGGVILATSKGAQEKALDDVVFAAKRNTLLGPIKTQFGYYVAQVTKISVATQQTEAQAKAAITTLLNQQAQDKALNTFSEGFQKKWKAKTDCRSGFNNLAQLCKNAPKASTTATTTTPTTGTTTTG